MTPAAMGASECLAFVVIMAVLAAGASAALIVLLRPLLLRYAMARPSARGLHTTPTPQGGGIAVLAAGALAAGVGAAWLGLDPPSSTRLVAVLCGAAALAVLGLWDDIRPLPPLPRLLVQIVVMAVGVAALPAGTRILPALPAPAESAILVLAGTWFLNLTNFMDGMDWMTVTETVPVTAVIVLAWCLGALPGAPGLIALGLLGGLLGYAPFNKPVARLFLGDVGSLPIGFLVAYGLFSLAGRGRPVEIAAALLPCLYYVADSGITLVWRLWHRQRVWEPHRTHFYQVAVARGMTTWQVLARVAATNLMLAGLAVVSLGHGWMVQATALALGGAVVAVLLAGLSRPRHGSVD